ncbi:DUF4399 domain-containing protein [Enterovirga aerilata]|uniref:DUF4399 domain-containing protein n=1 Tax=Enterovirga aerilata TaxID=2730920 RepID=A0A849I6N1_9HYPH|nr:DUF4399 domain-containing protein [Enterovirga sp. DB1703]NNM72069.1 DUF4399 domain-containing protein [Enterovirga sp. DB1703]
MILARHLIAAAAALLPLAAAAQTPPPHPGHTAEPQNPLPPTPAPADAKLYFIAPVDGARIRGPFVVQFGLRGMGVTQAGVTTPNTGHHHLLVNVKTPLDPNEPIPADKNHIHFGGGQTETRLDLPPGRHTLQLVLGDALHRPFQPIVASERIEIVVLRPVTKKKRRRL